MKFVVSSTSGGSRAKPCEGATEFTYARNGATRIGWFVELADFGALVEFINMHGECVLSTPYVPDIALELEIYDSYRE